jgi:F0F1-type ATP synthase membrane subunit c/vacuolar-type H+-ATPase subunit K
MKSKWTRFNLNPYTTHPIFGISVGTAVGLAATAASTGMSLAGGSAAAGAAEDAAATQGQFSQLAIDELRNALGPSIARLDKEQAWSDKQLQRQYRGAMGETGRYADAGARGLGRLNYLMGTDNGLGPQPTAPTAPKAPKYSKDPKQAAAQKKAYQKALRVYDRAKVKYETDSAAWQAGTAAQQNDPEYGSLMKPYEDTHGYGQRILDTAAEKYDDKYANEILGISRDTFEADDFETDPGYDFRRSEGNRGIEQSAAAGGSLNSGASLKALTKYNQDLASDEYGKAFGRWSDEHNRHLAGVTGQQAHDYNVWDRNKGTRLLALGGERDFDYGKFGDNRNFQLGALQNMVGVGQDATDDRNQLREYFSNQRTGNRLATANQLGNWRNANAAAIAEALTGQGNSQAAGQVGAANAWSQGLQGGGNALAYFGGQYMGRNGRWDQNPLQWDYSHMISKPA